MFEWHSQQTLLKRHDLKAPVEKEVLRFVEKHHSKGILSALSVAGFI